MPDFSYEKSYAGKTVCGVDEAGRGPLAGRVYAAACILPLCEALPADDPKAFLYAALNDSKKLTEKKRDALAPLIKEHAASYCIAWAEVEEIEELNILEADLLAMRRAIDGLSVKPDVALIDGNIARGFEKCRVTARAVIGGDGISLSVAAASILAKTARDEYCRDVLESQYPGYGFAVHKGYGTKAHYAAIDALGACPAHRMSFLTKYFEKKKD